MDGGGPGPRRRRLLWIAGALTFGLLAALALLDLRMSDTGGPGIIGFELAGSRDDVREILADWGDTGHDAALMSLWLDYPYLIAYGIFLSLTVAALRDGARERNWWRQVSVGTVLVPVPLVAAGFDAVENFWLLLALGGNGGDAAPVLGTAFAIGKFALMFVVLAYLLVAGATRAFRRSRVR